MSPCLNNESMSIQESMSVPEVWLYTMSLCLYNESLSNSCFHFYTMRNTIVRYSEIQTKKNSDIKISEIEKYILPIYRNTNYSNIEIQKRRNTTCRSAETQMTYLQK